MAKKFYLYFHAELITNRNTTALKKIQLLLLCLSLIFGVHAQKKAVTESGDEVILYNDGTWKYTSNNHDTSESVIKTNPDKFIKNNSSTFLLKSNAFNVGIWLDPKKWKFEKTKDGSETEFELSLKNEELYGLILSEKAAIPLESLKEVALINGKKAAPDLEIVKEEYRYVNGIKILLLQMNGTVSGVKFTYYGYYFSNDNGTLQFLTYTTQSFFAKYKKDAEALLNGLTEIK